MSDSGTNKSGDSTNVDVSIEQADDSPSLLFRAVYFIFIGWWASGIWLTIAWLLNLTIVLMPLGIKMINKTPKIVSLKEREIQTSISTDSEGNISVTESHQDQHSLLIRGVWFLFVGWWLSGIWTGIAWVVSITIIGLPAAVWMYGKLPFIVSLYKY